MEGMKEEWVLQVMVPFAKASVRRRSFEERERAEDEGRVLFVHPETAGGVVGRVLRRGVREVLVSDGKRWRNLRTCRGGFEGV